VRETIWPAFVIVARDELLASHPDKVKAMLGALNQQCKMVSESEDSVARIADRYKLEVEEVAKWKALTKWSEDFVCPSEAIQKTIQYVNRLGIADAPEAISEDVWHALA